MRTLIRWAQSNQGCLTIIIGIGLYYVAVYRPLSHRTENVDQPLQQAWRDLEAANRSSLTQDRLDLDTISRGLLQLETSFTDITNANQKLLSRIAIDPDYAARTQSPFQLIDFQNQRQSSIETLQTSAASRSTTVQPAVFEGFPQHQSDQPDPQYLWTELALTHHLVLSMIYADISEIESIKTYRQRVPESLDLSEHERLIPFFTEVSLSGNANQLMRLLAMLPSRSEEIGESLKIDYPPAKPSLYIDKILVRKDSPPAPDTVSVWMKVVGFIQLSKTPNHNQEG